MSESKNVLLVIQIQDEKIEALEYLVSKIEVERIVENLDYSISTYGDNPTLENHKKHLIEAWEKVNAPHKWSL